MQIKSIARVLDCVKIAGSMALDAQPIIFPSAEMCVNLCPELDWSVNQVVTVKTGRG